MKLVECDGCGSLLPKDSLCFEGDHIGYICWDCHQDLIEHIPYDDQPIEHDGSCGEVGCDGALDKNGNCPICSLDPEY